MSIYTVATYPKSEDCLKLSIVVPVYNEEQNIIRCLNSILKQTLGPNAIDLVIVFASCEDNTLSLINDWAAENSSKFWSIRLVHNGKKTLAAGWNLGVKYSRSELVILTSGHFFMNPDYSEILTSLMVIHQDIFTIGGNITADTSQKPMCLFSRIFKQIYQTRSLVGNANYRVSQDKDTNALDYDCDTACFGCYRRHTFLTIKGFNEDLLRSQDFELHCRLRKLGLRQARSTFALGEYRLRIHPLDAYKYAYINGFWISRPLTKYPYMFRLRHSIPFLFHITLLFSLGLLFITPLASIPLAFLLLSYTGYLLSGFRNLNITDAPVGIILAFLYHNIYAIGYSHGLLISLVKGRL